MQLEGQFVLDPAATDRATDFQVKAMEAIKELALHLVHIVAKKHRSI